jgi:acetyl-CoA carboxylase biotin carboxyl carrier protein
MSKDQELTIDGDLVRTLAALLAETGLTEVEYAVGDRRIRIARSLAAVSVSLPQATATALPPGSPAASAEMAPADHPGAIKAPMVGTVYLGPQPEAPPFAKLGEMVSEGDVLLIIEAMKVMNQIRATRAGRLVKVLVEDGAPVEYGEVLMVVE